MRTIVHRFVADERGSGTTSSAIRIGLFVVAGLAVVGLAYAKIIEPLMTAGAGCATAAAGSQSGIATGAGATLAGC